MASPDDVLPASRLSPTTPSDTEDPLLLPGASDLEGSTATKRPRSRFSFANLFSSENKDVNDPKKDIKHELKEVQHRNQELQKENGELRAQVRTLQTKCHVLQREYTNILEPESKLVHADNTDLEREMAEKIRLEAELNEANNVIADLTAMKVSMEQIQLLTQIFERKIEEIVPNSLYQDNVPSDDNTMRGIDQRVNNLLMSAKECLETAVGQHKAISEKAERLTMELELNEHHIALLTGLLQEIREELAKLRRVFPTGCLHMHLNHMHSLTSDGGIIDRCVQRNRSLIHDDRNSAIEMSTDHAIELFTDHEDAQLDELKIGKKLGAEDNQECSLAMADSGHQATKRSRNRFSFANLFSSKNNDAKEQKRGAKKDHREDPHSHYLLQKENEELQSHVGTLQTNYDALQRKYTHLEREHNLVKADKRDVESDIGEYRRLEEELKECKEIFADLIEENASQLDVLKICKTLGAEDNQEEDMKYRLRTTESRLSRLYYIREYPDYRDWKKHQTAQVIAYFQDQQLRSMYAELKQDWQIDQRQQCSLAMADSGHQATKRSRNRFSFANLFSSKNNDAKEQKRDAKKDHREDPHSHYLLQKENEVLRSHVGTLQTNYNALQRKYTHLERENNLVKADKSDLERDISEYRRLEEELKELKEMLADLTKLNDSQTHLDSI